MREDPRRRPALDAAINSARVCLDNGIDPPGGAASLGLSPEDFGKAEEGAEAKSRRKLEDKQKGEEGSGSAEARGTSAEDKGKEKKAELPRTGGVGGVALFAIAAGALLAGGGLLVCRVFR